MTSWRLDALLAVALVVAAVALWRLPAGSVDVGPWPAQVAGFALSPFQRHQDPAQGSFPSRRELAADLELLARRTRAVRVYTLDGSLAEVPALAAAHGIAVTAGIPLTGRAGPDGERLHALRRAIRESRNVRAAILGNETVLERRLSPSRLAAVLASARAALPVPVSTAEPWHVWLAHPELAANVDFLTVHLLPYWEGVPAQRAVDVVAARMAELRAAFPGKRLVIGEVGWPSRGPVRGSARPGRVEQARFLSGFLERAAALGWEYFLLEAFDQPWKRAREGEVGGHWGVYDAARGAKWAPGGRVERLPGWGAAAGITAALALALFALLRRDAARLAPPGRAVLALAAGVVAAALVALAHLQLGRYWSPAGIAWALLAAVGLAGAAAVLLVEVHEWVEARWCRRRRVTSPPLPEEALPWVTVHLPVCSEPPELVRETLAALAALDYPRLEVLVVDNNTADPALWRPLRAMCAALGERFRFLHLASVPGYKAGALNVALARTRPESALVAVIDADYRVDPRWLREAAAHFADPRVVIVQAPQDYRDGGRSLFKSLCWWEYRGFFRIGMVTRDARNAIIQHGTMTVVRRAALEAAGGWSEWTITEDAELGLRLLAGGGIARYVPQSRGRGLIPDTFLDYKRQRLRWALGAVQVLRAHRALLLSGRAPGGARLGAGQRYHFVAGWLPWLADGAALVLALLAVAWTGLMLGAPGRFTPPHAAIALVPVALFATRLLKHLHLYRTRVGADLASSAGAALAGLALMPTAGLAVLMGVAGMRRPFRRTPKLAGRHRLVAAVAAAAPETALGAALVTCAVAAGSLPGHADLTAWRAMLAVMSVPCLSALALSLISALPERARRARRLPGLGLPRPGSQET